MVKYSIVTVSYNSEEFIEKFLQSVSKYKPKDSEIVILDSGSMDKTTRVIKKFDVKLIESKENVGFGRGNNLAAKETQGEYLFFLNPDTEVRKSFLEKLVDFYESEKKIGLVGPRLVMLNGSIQPSVRKLPTVWGAFREYILGDQHQYSEYIPKTTKPVDVEVIYGAAMLIKKDLFAKLGGFDEKFFMYYEDTDLCRKVRELGYKIYYYPKVEIIHLVGAVKTDQDRYQLNLESARKYHGVVKAAILHLIFLIHRLRQLLALR